MQEENNMNNVNPSEPQGTPEQAPIQPERPVSPEAQAAMQNQAAEQTVPPQVEPANPTASNAPKGAPKMIGKETQTAKKNSHFLLGCSFGLLFLFVFFVALMVLVISRQGAGSPVLNAFGLEPAQLKSFLLSFISFSFGILSIILFVLTIIGVFRLVSAKKDDKARKKKGIFMTVFSALPLIFVIIVWTALWNFINNLQIATERVVAEVLIIEPQTEPPYEAPVEITLSALNVAKAIQANGLGIESMKWDLDGDGSFETAIGADPEVRRLYTRREIVNVGLEVVVIGEDRPRVYNKLINIGEALFTITPETGTAPQEVAFDARDLVGETKLQSADWDFDGDGTYDIQGTNLRPRYTFDRIGTYTIHLRLVDENNVVENYYRDIEIKQSDSPLLSAEIVATPGFEGTLPFKVRLDGGNSTSLKGEIVNYEWDLGDGTALQTGRSISHIYNTAGEYTVKLTVREDTGKEATSTEVVVVSEVSSVPEAKIKTNLELDEDGVLRGEFPLTVNFDASESEDSNDDIVDYNWDFDGDGEADNSGQKVSHTFEAIGTFTVKLMVKDAQDQEGEASLTVEVNQPGTKAVIDMDPQEGTAPLLVAFDGSSSSAFEGGIVSYEWDFGDGSPVTITGATVTHKYNAVGTYDVVLKVVTSNGDTATTSQQVFVREVPLRACFTPSRNDGPAPLTVAFDPQCATGSVATFNWDFGDGKQSAARKPNHTFQSPGQYTVTLEVVDDKNNISVFTDTITAQ